MSLTLRRPSILTAAIVLVAAGCSDAPAPAVELQQAKARWSARQPAAYRMTVVQHCFCGMPPAIEVVVRGGVVQSRRDVATGEPVEERMAGLAGTVETLFGVVEQAIANDAHHLDATFDRRLGYPARVVIDHRVEMVDDELTLLVQDFVVE